MEFDDVINSWIGLDPDDISGYLMDHLDSEMRSDGVTSKYVGDEEIQTMIKEDPQKVYDILINIRNALRAEDEG